MKEEVCCIYHTLYFGRLKHEATLFSKYPLFCGNAVYGYSTSCTMFMNTEKNCRSHNEKKYISFNTLEEQIE